MRLVISFEGCEGSGKSAQAALLAQRLRGEGVDALLLREPGSTEFGDNVRAWLKGGMPGGESLSERAEALLFAAARAELVGKRVIPHLEADGMMRAVVLDRYVDSSFAYQGGGRGIDDEELRVMNKFATRGVTPDLTFLLDIEPSAGLERIGSMQYGLPIVGGETAGDRRLEGGRFEDEPLAFHRRVRGRYLDIAEADRRRWRVLDATLSVEDISEVIWREVEKFVNRATGWRGI